MFEIPEAKRVRREDLYSPQPSPPPSTSDSDELAAQLAQYYGTPPPAPARTAPPPPAPRESEPEPDSEAEEFEFRLFSSSGGAVKVVLEKEDEDLGDGAFLRARDPRWYFADGGRSGEFEAVAVSGQQVLRGAAGRFWGLEVPWRVRVVRVGGEGGRRCGKMERRGDDNVGDEVMGGMGGKRKKPGKKRRILLRVRAKTEMQKDILKREEEEKRNELEREKKSKKNKEKQAKRRAREKAEKAAKRDEAGDVTIADEN